MIFLRKPFDTRPEFFKRHLEIKISPRVLSLLFISLLLQLQSKVHAQKAQTDAKSQRSEKLEDSDFLELDSESDDDADLSTSDLSEYLSEMESVRKIKGFVAFEPIGFSPRLGWGFGGGAYLNSKTSVDFYFISSFRQKPIEEKFWFSSLCASYFLNSSGYFSIGLGAKKSAEASNLILALGRNEERMMTNTGVLLGAGSRWWWSELKMHFGVQWLGVYIPVKAISRSYKSTGFTTEQEKKARDDFNKQHGKTTLQLTRFTLGWLF